MNENTKNNEIDLMQSVRAVIKRWWIVLLATVLGGFIAFGYTYVYVSPTYTSTAMMYVDGSSSVNVGSGSINLGDLNLAKSLIDTYRVILKSRLNLEKVIKEGQFRYSPEQLYGMIAVNSVDETEIFSISVTSGNAQEACDIANTIVKVLPQTISEVISASNVKVVDMAIVPTSRSGPGYSNRTFTGAIVGFLLSVVAIVIYDVLDNTVKNDQWLTTAFSDEFPILAVIPDANHTDHKKYGKYKNYYDSTSSKTEKGGNGDV